MILVDDSSLVRDAIGAQLDALGWEVRSVAGGEAALAMARVWMPDAVVCDLHMPGMAGLEVIRELRRIDRNLPVVILSNDDELTAVLGAVRRGAFDYVIKHDHDSRALEAALERAVAHARLARENLRLTQELERANTELEARVRELHEQHGLLEQARARSDALLRNILPDPIAERLMRQSRAIADGFDEVTVLFADIVGFTRLAAGHTPLEIVVLLNEIISRFDELTERHGLEKIKTMGDAYMAAAGLPVPRADHAEAAADMALDMLRVVEAAREGAWSSLEVRIGLHSGPVVAGVIGTKKFSYDVWGDTVNVASRMEASSVPGRVQVTDETRRRLAGKFALEPRGPIAVKGKGQIHTWFLLARASGR